jgi:hypothetical protein
MNRIGVLGSLLGVFLLSTAVAAPDDGKGIPKLGSAAFGWQHNVEDWEPPPPGSGHGPIANDPAYPYRSNAQGNASGEGATVRITNSKDPILKPWAAAQMQKSNEQLFHGRTTLVPFTAQARCYPGGVPGQLLWPFEPFYVIQTPKIVYMMWQRDHWVRRIEMKDKHSEHVEPSWFGESIGHYEDGNTLVVDTIGLQTNMSFIDNFRTPHTEKLHVVERYTVSEDGKSLSAIVRVEDPETFNGPITMTKKWFRVDSPMLESVCGENNFDFFNQGLVPIPEAKAPDF